MIFSNDELQTILKRIDLEFCDHSNFSKFLTKLEFELRKLFRQ